MTRLSYVDQMKSGIVEITEPDLPTEAPQGENRPIHYLPHHEVVHQDSQATKLRIVYNGSAQALGDSYSLNDCLQIRPNCIHKLFDISIRFHWHKIAIIADDDGSDCEFLHFLWVKDPWKPPYEFIHLKFACLVFGLHPSPAILGTVLIHHIDKHQSKQPRIHLSANQYYIKHVKC